MRQRGTPMSGGIMYRKEEGTAAERGSSSGAGLRPHSAGDEYVTSLRAVLAAAVSDTLLAFARTSGPLCAVGKIPPCEPCAFPCLDVDLGLVFVSSKGGVVLQSRGKEHGSSPKLTWT